MKHFRRFAIFLLLAASLGLSTASCGVKGPLAPPPSSGLMGE